MSIGLDFGDVVNCLEFHHTKKDRIVGVNTRLLSDLILEQVPVATVLETKEVLTYYNGKYISNGKEFIHRILVDAISEYTRVDGTSAYNRHILHEVINIISGKTYVSASNFDSDLNIINLQNGLLNWRTGEFMDHTPEYKSRIQLPFSYDPNAKCPSIEKVFKTVLHKEDYVKALEFVGYCLYRAYPIQKVFIMIGPGKTGKSRFLDIITSFLGSENCSSVSMHDLERDRFATSDLYGSLLNGFGDMEQTTLPNINILKMLTSNKDTIRTQRKGKDAFCFINFAKFLFGTNKLAKVLDDTSGFYRRIELFPFDHVFTQDEYDPELLKNAVSEYELSGLLNLVLPYLEPLLERNEFTNAYDTETAEMKYKCASDPIRSFAEMFLVGESADCVAVKEDVFCAFERFCKHFNIKNNIHRNWFGRELTKAISCNRDSVRNVNGKMKTVYLNIRLKSDEEAFGEIT